ncbi:MAG: DUF1819 domain-containing protein [Deltaproteobacteria bacterium]|nr:DUF1819 domain-containing protein [Deltaproteobacteria bacterium]
MSTKASLAEFTAPHTHILKVMLVVEDSHQYWRNVDLRVPFEQRAAQAFQGRWFGAKSEARVSNLVSVMGNRFDAFPDALALLHSWGTVPAPIRPWICHWHTQLSDVIYRRFTGEFLPDRRDSGIVDVDRDAVARWVDAQFPGRWTPITCFKFASNMLSAAHEAGLIKNSRDPRQFQRPVVPDLALAYLLYLLRNVRIAGTLFANPYLRSVGLGPEMIEDRLATVPGIAYRSLGGVFELEWQFNGLRDWGNHAQGAIA